MLSLGQKNCTVHKQRGRRVIPSRNITTLNENFVYGYLDAALKGPNQVGSLDFWNLV